MLLCTNPLHAGYFFSFYFYVGLFFGAGISLTFFCVFTSLRLDIFSHRVFTRIDSREAFALLSLALSIYLFVCFLFAFAFVLLVVAFCSYWFLALR